MQKFVIVGAGPAGHNAALELSRAAPDDTIILLGAESSPPYERPALSKAFLGGSAGHDEIMLSRIDTYSDNRIDFHPNSKVEAIDEKNKYVVLESNEIIHYDSLLLCTGSRPRKISNEFLDGIAVHYLRTIEDASRLQPHVRQGNRIVIIGGGFIGLEVAATARQCGCEVIIIEAAGRLLSRGMPDYVSSWVRDVHVGQGCDVRLGVTPQDCVRRGGQTVIQLGDDELAADALVVAVGIEPAFELARAANLKIDNGIIVDEQFRTSDTSIFAAGEVASYIDPLTGQRHRTESWRCAIEQAQYAARAMAGQPAPFDKIPWLWSDQYDYNIQSLGFPHLAVRHRIRFDRTGRHWTLVGLDASSKPIGVVAVNMGRDISMFRRLMASGERVSDSLIGEFDEI